MKVTLGLLQHACTADPAANLKKTLALATQAAKRGAKIICTQELFRSQYFCQSEDHANFSLAEPIPGPSTKVFQQFAKIFRRVVRENVHVHRDARIAVENDGNASNNGEINAAAREAGQQLFELGRRPVRSG